MRLLSDAFAVAIVAVAVVWAVAVGVVAVARRPRRPRPGPAVAELPPEPPAVVNLLAHRYRVTAEAVPAVVLDLAARGHLEIVELAAGEQHVLHLRDDDRGDRLSEAEALVRDHLQRIAVQGVVPAAAMTTGPKDASATWWKRFRRAVVAEAQEAGLCRPVWEGAALALLRAGQLAVLVLGVLMALTGDSADDEDGSWYVLPAAAAVVLVLVVAQRLKASGRQRHTAAGLAASAAWLGVGEHLAETGRYETLPPGAVVLDGRRLAYACALGLAPVCVARLPLGAEDDRVAWSRYGQRWRPVRVRYPRFALGWGRRPAEAMAAGAGQVAASAFLLWVLDDSGVPWAAVAPAAVIFGVVLVRGLVLLVRAALDAGDHTWREGLVVRARVRQKGSRGDRPVYEHWLALDDGTSSTVRAYRVRPEIARLVAQDQPARLEVTPRLGYVRTAERVSPWPAPAAPPRSAPR